MRKLLVSEPSLTNFDKFSELANEVWNSGILTHNGPKVQELEKTLKEKWNIPYLSLVTNGTIAIEVALRALELPKGSKIITTPYTWIATVSSIVWQQYQPVFVDVDPLTLNIDPAKIEEKIDEETSAILAVHVFGNPCDVESIDEISKKYGLKVIYDGAHAVNVKKGGIDLSQWGDITTHSYHATKLYNCGEGGSIITKDPELAKRIERLRFFGHNDAKDIVHEGTNAKMHEISACIGLANLEMMDKSMEHRRMLHIFYRHYLETLDVIYPSQNKDECNFSYMPLILPSEEMVIKVMSELEKIDVIARRYFYPSVNTYPVFDYQSCPISEEMASRSICLPCHDRVTTIDVNKICNVIKSCF